MDYLPLKQLLLLLPTWEKPTSLSIYDEHDYRLNQALYELAVILHGIFPRLQSQLGQRYLSKALHFDFFKQHFRDHDLTTVLQERSGKMLIWNSKKAWEQAFGQRYKHVFSEPNPKKPASQELVDAGRSRGLASTILWTGHAHPHTVHKDLNAICFTLGDQGFDLATPGKIAQEVWEFARTCLPTHKQKVIYLYLSCPYPALVEALIQSFEQLKSLAPLGYKIHDILAGYSPKLSFMSFLSSTDQLAIFVDVENFPEILCISSQIKENERG